MPSAVDRPYTKEKNMPKSFSLPGFREFVQEPLEKHDPAAFNRIKSLISSSNATASTLFSRILLELTGSTYPNPEAKDLWRKALSHKRALEQKLGRTVSIITALSDLLHVAGVDEELVLTPTTRPLQKESPTEDSEEWIEKVLEPGHHLVKLREEMMRVRRYKHALSAILFEIDEFDTLTETIGPQLLTLIVKIVRKTIRTVDIVTRCSGGRFMVILPDTNQREARELANRLRLNIRDRTKRILPKEVGVKITASVAQYGPEERSGDFVRKLEYSLEAGEQSKRDMVYVA
jgi:diguanylate cyclase (GGDEF)-like protein